MSRTWPPDSFLSVSGVFFSWGWWITFFLFLRPRVFCLSPLFLFFLRLCARLVPITPQIPALSADVSALVSLSPTLTPPPAHLHPHLSQNWIWILWSVILISHIAPSPPPIPHLTPLLDTLPSDPLQSQYDSWLSLVDHLNIKAFVNLTLASSVRYGMQQLLFISGLGRWRHSPS